MLGEADGAEPDLGQNGQRGSAFKSEDVLLQRNTEITDDTTVVHVPAPQSLVPVPGSSGSSVPPAHQKRDLLQG